MSKTQKNKASSLIRSYRKLALKLKKNIETGNIQQWSRNKKQYILARLTHLLRLIRSHGVRVATISSISILSALSTQAQFTLEEPFDVPCEVSPWDELELASFSGEGTFITQQTLSGDLDNDGDEDLLVITSEDGSYIAQYFENTEDGLVELEGEDNPLQSFNEIFEEGGAPPFFFTFSLGDATLNGRLDLLLGEFKGEIACFENTEEGFEEPDEKNIEGSEQSDFASVSFTNLDADCEDEIVSIQTFTESGNDRIITVYDYIDGAYVESESMRPMFDEIDDSNPFSNELLYPYFFDIDGDGIDELVTISAKENFSFPPQANYYVKDDMGIYTIVDEMESPFRNVFENYNEDQFSLPIFDFGDVDGDGNLNMYVGFKSETNSGMENFLPPSIPQLLCIDTEIPIPAGIPCQPGQAAAVPTLGQWGVIILGLLVLIFGLVGIKEERTNTLLGMNRKVEN